MLGVLISLKSKSKFCVRPDGAVNCEKRPQCDRVGLGSCPGCAVEIRQSPKVEKDWSGTIPAKTVPVKLEHTRRGARLQDPSESY